MAIPEIRKGQYAGQLTREVFGERFRASFQDPAFQAEVGAIDRLEDIAWDGYVNGRKAPRTAKAGPEFDDPDYDLSVDWRADRDRLKVADQVFRDPATPSRVLIVNGSARNDGTCPGEVSKSFRMSQWVTEELRKAGGLDIDLLDLSVLTSEYGRHIYPCKGCVSTAMPLCHWPCSCYPNHSLNQTGDWMSEIYEQWVSAHAVIILTPVYWYQSPSPLKLMIDRLVCADGGNPDPTRTHGKDPKKAKQIELDGWDYPQHLKGRLYGVVAHGDVAGIEGACRSLTDWLDWMGFIDAGAMARLDRFIGYYEPYATSHDTLDADTAVQQEVRNVARSVAAMLPALRSGALAEQRARLPRARPK